MENDHCAYCGEQSFFRVFEKNYNVLRVCRMHRNMTDQWLEVRECVGSVPKKHRPISHGVLVRA
jgi:hypothetical protein